MTLTEQQKATLVLDSTVLRNLWPQVDAHMFDESVENNPAIKGRLYQDPEGPPGLILLEAIGRTGIADIVIPEIVTYETAGLMNGLVLDIERNGEAFAGPISVYLDTIAFDPAHPHTRVESATCLEAQSFKHSASVVANKGRLLDAYREKDIGEIAAIDIAKKQSGSVFVVSDDRQARYDAIQETTESGQAISALNTRGILNALHENKLLQQCGVKEGVGPHDIMNSLLQQSGQFNLPGRSQKGRIGAQQQTFSTYLKNQFTQQPPSPTPYVPASQYVEKNIVSTSLERPF